VIHQSSELYILVRFCRLSYLRQRTGRISPALRPGDVVVMDNLSSHKVAGVRERIAAKGASLLYLPPYSPDLNPIEKAWSKAMQLLRAAKARSKELLDQATARTLQHITPEDAKGWFNHCIHGLQ
jgi:transposase